MKLMHYNANVAIFLQPGLAGGYERFTDQQDQLNMFKCWTHGSAYDILQPELAQD